MSDSHVRCAWLATIALSCLGCGRVGYEASSDSGLDAVAAPDDASVDAPPVADAPSDSRVSFDDALRDAHQPPDAFDGGSPSDALARFLTDYAELTCSALLACFGPVYSDFDAADCTRTGAAPLLERVLPQILDSERAGRLLLHAEQLASCSDAIRALAPCELVVDGIPTACELAITGLVPAGGRCTSHLDCVGDDACVPDGATSCDLGVCRPRGAEGATCGSSAENELLCARALRCVAGVCRVAVAPGEACMDEDACEPSTACYAGQCEPLETIASRRLGEACDLLNWCVEPASCTRPLGGTCVAPVPSGSPCTEGAFPDTCPTGELCQSGACTALPAPGEACGRAYLGQPRCARGAFCDGSSVPATCRYPAATGAGCSVPADCASGHCATGTCVPPPPCP